MTKMATMMKIMNMLVGMACSKHHMMMMMMITMDMLVGVAGMVACFKFHKRKRMCTQQGNSEVGFLRFRVRFPPLSQATPE